MKAINLLDEIHNIARDNNKVYDTEIKYCLAKAIRYLEKNELPCGHIQLTWFTKPGKQEYKFTTTGIFTDVRIQINPGNQPILLVKVPYYRGVYQGVPNSYSIIGDRLILNPIPQQEYPVYMNVRRTFTNDDLNNYCFYSMYHDLLVYATLFYFYTDYLQDDNMAQKYMVQMIAEKEQLLDYSNRHEMSGNLVPWTDYY